VAALREIPDMPEWQGFPQFDDEALTVPVAALITTPANRAGRCEHDTNVAGARRKALACLLSAQDSMQEPDWWNHPGTEH
jgi:hypothetical protein